MASLDYLVRQNKGAILDGIAHVVIWKNGRSWNMETFYEESGSYDEGYVFMEEDVERLEEIAKEDHKAIVINGYHNGFGSDDPEEAYYNSVEAIKERIMYYYISRFCQLKGSFLEGWVIR